MIRNGKFETVIHSPELRLLFSVFQNEDVALKNHQYFQTMQSAALFLQ